MFWNGLLKLEQILEQPLPLVRPNLGYATGMWYSKQGRINAVVIKWQLPAPQSKISRFAFIYIMFLLQCY